MATGNGINNRFQIPNTNPVINAALGIQNKFTKGLQNIRPFIQAPNQPVIYTTPGTYTFIVPGTQIQPLNFVLIGGGGGGGGSASSSTAGGGGGQGGSVLQGSVLWSAGESLSVTIGAGGAGGTGGGAGGLGGGNSSISWGSNIIIYSNGGAGGAGGISGNSPGGNDSSVAFENQINIPYCSMQGNSGNPGYPNANAAGGKTIGWVIGSTNYLSGSSPMIFLINGTIYTTGGGIGASVPSSGNATGGSGGNGLCIFYVNG